MNASLEQKILYWLRHASKEGSIGFYFDEDEQEQNEDWQYFEKQAIEDIDDFLYNEGII